MKLISFAAVVAVAGSVALAAAAEVCSKSGEETSGLNKFCYYRCSFGETTQNVSSAALCPITAQASAAASAREIPRNGGACFKTGEREGDGMTKQCIYDCTGSKKVVTINSAQICPITAR